MIRTPWWFPMLVGWIALLLSFPIDGLPGIGLAVAGAVLVLLGYAKFRRDTEEQR